MARGRRIGGVPLILLLVLAAPLASAHRMSVEFGEIAPIEILPGQALDAPVRLLVELSDVQCTSIVTDPVAESNNSLILAIQDAPWWLTLSNGTLLVAVHLPCGKHEVDASLPLLASPEAPRGSELAMQVRAYGLTCDGDPCGGDDAPPIEVRAPLRVTTPRAPAPGLEDAIPDEAGEDNGSTVPGASEDAAPAVGNESSLDAALSDVRAPGPAPGAGSAALIVGAGAVAVAGAGALAWRASRAGGARPREPPRELAGTASLLRKYVMDVPLGKGAFGSAWLATHKGLGRRVVLKTLHAGWAGDDAARARFRREARILALVDHPNVTRIFDMEEADGRLYIVMEHVEGGNLHEHVRRLRRPLSMAEARVVLLDVLAGLAHVHAQGVVHRDVKPTNVLVTREGRAKLADFGVSEGSRASVDLAASAGGGTPFYMAPERLAGAEADARADLYSVAVLAHEVLTGEMPLARRPRDVAELRVALAAPPRIAPGAGAWEDWLLRGLARDPAARFGSADEMARALPGAEAAGS